MSTQTNGRIRFAARLVLLALALAMIPAAGYALAGAPASVPDTRTAAPPSQSNEQQAGRPQATGPANKLISESEMSPSEPLITLYNQYNNFGSNSTSSQNFEAGLDQFDDQAADDFVIAAGDTWTIDQVDVRGSYFGGDPPPGGPAATVNVFFYSNSGSLPGALVASRLNQAYVDPGPGTTGSLQVALPSNVVLGPGHYWVSVQVNMDYGAPTAGQWGWTNRTIQANNPAAWQNPGDGFASGCTTWGLNSTCTGSTSPDLAFRLLGTAVLPTVTSTPTNTPGGCGSGFADGPVLPSAHVRAVGVWSTDLDRFYVMGGRAADTAGTDIVNPRYYDPGLNVWVVDTATFPDTSVNNMVCANLIGPSGQRIYCVGGSAAGGSTTTGRVAVYDPVASSITTLATDPWTPGASASTLPGGFAVTGAGTASNKLYILGGFVAFGTLNMSNQIWEFNPFGANGARWTLKTAVVPNPSGVSNGMGYIPATTIGGLIYTAGGSQFDGAATIQDTELSFRYDPVADVVSDAAVPDLPSPGSAETRALNVGGKVWLIGGGRDAPNPSSTILQFDPLNPGLGWSAVTSFTGPRRNFPVDIDPATGKIYLAGGYMPTTPTDTMQIFTPGLVCTPSPSRTPTITSTPTVTHTPTITPTPVCPGSWVQMAPYPTPALDEAIAVQGGILYSFSGVVSSNISPLSYKYDPVANSWSAIAPLPSGRENASAVSDGTHIFIMGGNDSAGNVTSTLWRYDPGANTYITLTAATTATRAQAAAYHNGRIYKFGGLTAASATTALEIYNIAGGTWSAGAAYPQGVGFHGAVAMGGFIYGAGGTSSGGIETVKTYRYDPVGNSWDDAAIADLPETRWGSASDVLKGKWLLAGGFVDGNFSWTSTRWNSVSNAWEHVDLMAAPRARLAGGTIGTAFYAVAGGDPTTPDFFDGSNNNQRYINTCQLSNLVGHVVWQQIPQNDPRSARPITLTLKSAGTEMNYPVQNTDNFGFFTVSVSGLPNGTYNWRVQSPDGPPVGNTVAGFLANCGTVALSGASTTQMENSQVFGGITGCTVAPGCIKGGDASNDNIVSIVDFNTLKAQFNQVGIRTSDFNNDLIVNISDFNILKSTFNQNGCGATVAP